MRLTLPSKRIAPIIAACIIAGGGVAFAASYKTPAAKLPTHLLVENPSSSTVIDNSWRKTVADFAATGKPFSYATSSVAEDNTPLTTTQQLSIDLMSSYLGAQSGNQTLTSDQENQLANDALSKAVARGLPQQPIVHGKTELAITQNGSDAAIKTYANNVVTALLTNAPKQPAGAETEIAIVNSAILENHSETIKMLDPIITSYQQTIKSLLKIKVPSQATTIHLAIINDFETLIPIDQVIANYVADPAGTILAVQKYNDASSQLAQDLKALALFFESKNMNSNENDQIGRFINDMDSINI